MNDYYTNYLCHHGIKGQKWGVRRYQNPDGSLTAAGQKRYANAEFRAERARQEAATAHKIADRYTSAMDKKVERREADAEKAKRGEPKISKETWKKIAIAGGVAAGTALAAYGAVKLSNSIKNKAFQQSMTKGMDAYNSLRVENRATSSLLGMAGKYDSSFADAKNKFDADSALIRKYYKDDVFDTAKNNSRNLKTSINTLRTGGRKSIAELDRAGRVSISPVNGQSMSKMREQAFRNLKDSGFSYYYSRPFGGNTYSVGLSKKKR